MRKSLTVGERAGPGRKPYCSARDPVLLSRDVYVSLDSYVDWIMATFHCKFLEKFHKCLVGVALVLGRRERVHRGNWTPGNNPRVVGSTWHYYYIFIYYLSRSTLENDPISTKTQQFNWAWKRAHFQQRGLGLKILCSIKLWKGGFWCVSLSRFHAVILYVLVYFPP